MTGFKTLETAGPYSLVECYPKTGRQHQIRVHLEHLGHPIVGDKLYGMPDDVASRIFDRTAITAEIEARLKLPRHALHAAGIRFTNPMTAQKIEFNCELPPDLKRFMDEQRSKASHPTAH